MSAGESLAIVLRVLPRREDDLFCELLLREGGRRWGVARSGRKSRRRFGTSLAPLNVLKVLFEERRGGDALFLKEASVALPLGHLTEELQRIGVAFFCAELVRDLIPEGSPEPAKFDLLLAALRSLNQGEEPVSVKEAFERNLLRLAGLEPHLKDCLRCHRQMALYYFVFREGGVFCSRCLPSGSAYEEIKPGQIGRVLTSFLEYSIGKRLKTAALFSK